MNKEFVPHEQSSELRELGFNEKCFSCFIYEVPKLKWELNFIISNNERIGIIAAPTFSQAFRFFRKKYKLGHSICPYSLNSHIIELEPIDDEPKEYTVYVSNPYNYEQAELECINKLIEIVKNK
jgi:hypothetical protein